MPTSPPNSAQLNPKIVARLGQLILLLSSPHDGEKVAACGAIVRTLGAAGLDLHALADCVRSASAGERERPKAPPAEEMSPQDEAAWCLRVGAALLSARERKFLEDIARAHYRLSDKQLAWLDSIVARIEDAGGR